MEPFKRRKPVPRNRRPAIRKTSKDILTEILGTLMAAAIFAATMWSSAFGMSGGFDPSSDAGYMLAGVVDDE